MRNKQKLRNYQTSNKTLINYCENEVLAILITNIYNYIYITSNFMSEYYYLKSS